MKDIVNRIKKHRQLKGLSHENMASELQISQVSYTKIENGTTKLTVERLIKIAEILEAEVSELMGLDTKYQLSQINKDNSTGYLQQIENFHQENKEVYEKLIQAKDEQIALLRELKNN